MRVLVGLIGEIRPFFSSALTVAVFLVGLLQNFLCAKQVLQGSSRLHAAMMKRFA